MARKVIKFLLAMVNPILARKGYIFYDIFAACRIY